MPTAMQSLPSRYGMAFLAVGLVLLLKKMLDPMVGAQSPFLLFFLSTMASSWLGGFGPGLLASVTATVLSDYFFLTPGKMFLQNPFEENFRLGVFFLEATLISLGVATLKRTHHELKEADKHKDDFLAMLAHELRNPLAAICSAVEVLRLSGPKEPDLYEMGDVIDRQARQMVRMVDDLLDVSRVVRGKVKLQKESVEVACVAARAVEASRQSLDARKQKFTVALPPEAVWVEADDVRLAQILTNLLNNAAKYTPECGSIRLDVEREGVEVVFRVRDTGVGIPAAMLPRIFDLFAQVDSEVDRSQGGLGIGLALVRRLVEMHGGSVEAFSAGPGQGSEFVVRMPVSAEVATQNAIGSGGSGGRRLRWRGFA